MKILCLVDNSVQPLSTFWGEHGLSFLVESGNDRVLFDTGASGSVLLHNLETLTPITPEVCRLFLNTGRESRPMLTPNCSDRATPVKTAR